MAAISLVSQIHTLVLKILYQLAQAAQEVLTVLSSIVWKVSAGSAINIRFPVRMRIVDIVIALTLSASVGMRMELLLLGISSVCPVVVRVVFVLRIVNPQLTV